MAITTRQTVIFGIEDWKKLYLTYREADFQSYDFESLRKSFIDYLRVYYPETFNDYIESSEFIALLDVIAFMGQSLAFRSDLNARENYIDTAERRDSVIKLANLVGYSPKRNTASQGYLKILSVSTTENVVDFNGINLSNSTINWNDPTNANWQEQFGAIINAALADPQRIGRPGNRQIILGVETSEYAVNLVPGFLPIIPFTSTVDGIVMPFEAVSASSLGEDFVYELPPQPNGLFNILFRNDRLGFASPNTGYFVLFKQGTIQNQDFNLTERLTNRTVNINIEGINNEDVWLYQLNDLAQIDRQWRRVDSVYAGAVEQLAPDERNIYSVTSRTNDQITLVFGDGVFSEIPVGTFRNYVRASNGLQYTINPEEIQSVVLPISYVSRNGRLETLTMTVGLQSPVTNAQARETINQIKTRAPARYYTQNRMVNGEDYTNFPFTQFPSIIKSKAVNRTSIGVSRYLDLIDPTGKYSSINTFSTDGVLYQEEDDGTFYFTIASINDISDMIFRQLEPSLQSLGMQHFYYSYFPRVTFTGLGIGWNQTTVSTNQTTGYFINAAGAPQQIGSYASDNKEYIVRGALVKFIAPTGQYFDVNGRLITGTVIPPGGRVELWTTVTNVVLDGTNFGTGNLDNGLGPVTLNEPVPTGALVDSVIPLFISDLPQSLQAEITNQVELNRDFGLGFDNLAQEWYLINSTNLDIDAAFSFANARDNSGTGLDASWLVQYITNGQQYTVNFRRLEYVFASVLENRFFYDGSTPIYDSRTGLVIADYVNVLKVNTLPDTSLPLNIDYRLRIVGQPIESDGYVDDFRVLVSYDDTDGDGVPDDPDFFKTLVQPSVNASQKLVFLQLTVDFDNLERYLPVNQGVVNTQFPTKASIELAKSAYIPGQIFYAYNENTFYELVINAQAVRSLNVRTDFISRVGRQGFSFQYRHNTPLSRRLDPSVTNIIDIYVVTNSYYTSYTNWIRDTTGTVPQPEVPTQDQLTTDYQGLQDYKMISDNVIINNVNFKPLFGNKAAPELQAVIKVIKAYNTTVSDSEIKSQVLANMNQYFDIDAWDFGDTFYFSELAAYLHRNMGDLINTVVLVPVDSNKSFGDLYEIRSGPSEIFVNGATVDNIEVVPALTQSQLRATAPVTLVSMNPVNTGTSSTQN